MEAAPIAVRLNMAEEVPGDSLVKIEAGDRPFLHVCFNRDNSIDIRTGGGAPVTADELSYLLTYVSTILDSATEVQA